MDYSRQITYLSKENQSVIQKSCVAIIGLGGLGSVAGELLCRMGVGKLLLCDDDIVAENNLSRQHLYENKDINKLKVNAAKKHLTKINPFCNIEVFPQRAEKNSMDWCKKADVVLDCTDRHKSKRNIDYFCKKHALPWIHGAAVQEIGSVFVFLPKKNTSYDTLYGAKTKNFLCKDLGVLATITTLVGTMQASFAIQLLLKKDVPKTLLRINARTGFTEQVIIPQQPL